MDLQEFKMNQSQTKNELRINQIPMQELFFKNFGHCAM